LYLLELVQFDLRQLDRIEKQTSYTMPKVPSPITFLVEKFLVAFLTVSRAMEETEGFSMVCTASVI
jgi:hypothetical protein